MVRARAKPSREQPPAGSQIDGVAFRRMLAAGSDALRAQADALNAINVFPIPDGDTGTNMSQTMSAALDEVGEVQGDDLPEIAKALAQGALMGARGNSGVILSQILRGFAGPRIDAEQMDASGLADAFESGREAAYRVVSQPQEGTILTAITAAAEAARGRTESSGNVELVLGAAVDATRDAVARTPELLPVLKAAGVVDAGAEGLYVLLDGMLRGLQGGYRTTTVQRLGVIDASWLAATKQSHGEDAHSGFCTEFVIQGSAIEPEEVRQFMSSLGDSLLVVGGGDLVRVHVHTQTPKDVLAYARTLGSVSHEKIDDLEVQLQEVASQRNDDQRDAVTGVAVVAVASGGGLAELMRSLGASAVISGGQTMNPSAGEIRTAIESTGASEVVVLPNNKNVILAAEQAAAGLASVRVLPSRSMPQGVAALVALNPEGQLEENAAQMHEAMGHIKSAEVTLAARATTVGGLEVRKGQPIGIVDGELVVAEQTVADAVAACVERMVEGCDATLVTLYAGAGVDEQAAAALAQQLRSRFGIELEVVDGGQPHYSYLIGVE